MITTTLRERIINRLKLDPVFGNEKSPVKIIDNVRDPASIRAGISSPPFILVRFDSMISLSGDLVNNPMYRVEFYTGLTRNLENEGLIDKYMEHLCRIMHYPWKQYPEHSVRGVVTDVRAFTDISIAGTRSNTYDGFAVYVADGQNAF